MKSMWKIIFKVVAGFSVLVGASAIIWRTAVYFNTKDVNESVIQEQLEIVINNQNAGTRVDDSICVKLDELVRKVDEISDNQVDIAENQKALRNSYSRYLSNDERLTKEDFLNYMEGLTFDFKKKEIVSNSIALDEIMIPLSELEK
jgi:hypothetical protein